MFDEISLAVSLLKKGEVVAFPTETVYGLGARVFDEAALKKIYEIKGRPADNPLIVHVAKNYDISSLAVEIPDDFYLLQRNFFPGPLTVVLKRRPQVPPTVSAGLDTIAIRMPSHKLAQKLLEALGEPIAAPSANLSGRPSPTTAEHVLEDLKGKVPLVLDGGACEIGIESTVVSLVHGSPMLLRLGAVSAEEIEKALGKKLSLPLPSQPHASPGMKHRHYAPSAKVILFSQKEKLMHHMEKHSTKRMVLSTFSAKDLYAQFRKADQAGMEEICVLCEGVIEAALMNRLTLAAKR